MIEFHENMKIPTDAIIKFPFRKMTANNPNAFYACLNYGEAFVPDEIAERSICINSDIHDILMQIG